MKNSASNPTLFRWMTGIFGSWLIVWVLGPFLLDSILIRTYDPDLDVNTLRPGDVVYWRSEGWGTTRIGPHGLPGWQPRSPVVHDVQEAGPDAAGMLAKVVIWGDSQVEGVCVDDPQKIHSQAIDIAWQQYRMAIDCLPMGRSGSDARDWKDLLPNAQQLWSPDLHIWVVTELSDLTVAVSSEASAEYHRWKVESPRWVLLAKRLRAEALIAASKRVLRDPATGQFRKLDFSLGPRSPVSSSVPEADVATTIAHNERIAGQIADLVSQLREKLNGRFAIIYAPDVPKFGSGWLAPHPDSDLFGSISSALHAEGVEVVDCRQDFVDLWRSQGKIARGFDNGMPTYGHLNPDGNRVVAEKIVAILKERLQR